MATKQQSSTPLFFNFLKEGLLLPTHNLRLFAAVFSIVVASSSLLLLGNYLAVQPLADEIRLDTKALNSTNPSTSSQEYLHLLQKFQDDTRGFLLTGATYLLFTTIIGSAIRIVVLFAAVATYSGELHTFGSLLGKVRTQLKGPLLTLAFVYALQIAYVMLLAAMAGLLMLLVVFKHYFVSFFVGSLLLGAFIFLIYFSILWSLSVVVAVAEPGCHGAGAFGRARRLVKGKLRRALLLVFVTTVLCAAISPVYSHAKMCAISNMAWSGLLVGFVYTTLMAAVGLFVTCAFTAFYYECKGSTEAWAAEYAMASTKEQIDA